MISVKDPHILDTQDNDTEIEMRNKLSLNNVSIMKYVKDIIRDDAASVLTKQGKTTSAYYKVLIDLQIQHRNPTYYEYPTREIIDNILDDRISYNIPAYFVLFMAMYKSEELGKILQTTGADKVEMIHEALSRDIRINNVSSEISTEELENMCEAVISKKK